MTMFFSGIQVLVLAQLPLAQAGQLLLVAAASFAVITLVVSTCRFHRLIQLSDDALLTPEACNDFFFIQVTRYLSKINRTSSGFGVLIVQFRTPREDRRSVQEAVLQMAGRVIRIATDKVCLFRDDSVALIIDTEPQNAVTVAQRIVGDLKQQLAGFPDVESFRAGMSCFPVHGDGSAAVIGAAESALQDLPFESGGAFATAVFPEPEASGTDETMISGELGRQDKNAAIDELTGVLKPGVIGSYLRKYLAELRRQKKPATLICVGINHVDSIRDLHGGQAADDVIAGVSRVLQRLTREKDLIGRYHQEGFVVLAPAALKDGEQIAVRLRDAVSSEIFVSGGRRIKASVSAGVTACPEHGRMLRDLFSGAHRALQVVRGWNTSACLVYDPAQHGKKDRV